MPPTSLLYLHVKNLQSQDKLLLLKHRMWKREQHWACVSAAEMKSLPMHNQIFEVQSTQMEHQMPSVSMHCLLLQIQTNLQVLQSSCYYQQTYRRTADSEAYPQMIHWISLSQTLLIPGLGIYL
ncbi:hypothetical protein V8G54_019010 [Vigna mungo]|uniref:Uncharacterized protein n=1 Tax=Vigna mungo TaxID=3915 RepID=A0AAQ3RS06_VIGMU